MLDQLRIAKISLLDWIQQVRERKPPLVVQLQQEVARNPSYSFDAPCEKRQPHSKEYEELLDQLCLVARRAMERFELCAVLKLFALTREINQTDLYAAWLEREARRFENYPSRHLGMLALVFLRSSRHPGQIKYGVYLLLALNGLDDFALGPLRLIARIPQLRDQCAHVLYSESAQPHTDLLALMETCGPLFNPSMSLVYLWEMAQKCGERTDELHWERIRKQWMRCNYMGLEAEDPVDHVAVFEKFDLKKALLSVTAIEVVQPGEASATAQPQGSKSEGGEVQAKPDAERRMACDVFYHILVDKQPLILELNGASSLLQDYIERYAQSEVHIDRIDDVLNLILIRSIFTDFRNALAIEAQSSLVRISEDDGEMSLRAKLMSRGFHQSFLQAQLAKIASIVQTDKVQYMIWEEMRIAGHYSMADACAEELGFDVFPSRLERVRKHPEDVMIWQKLMLYRDPWQLRTVYRHACVHLAPLIEEHIEQYGNRSHDLLVWQPLFEYLTERFGHDTDFPKAFFEADLRKK